MIGTVLRRSGGILLLPLLCFGGMALACRLAGTALFTGTSTWQLFFRGLTYVLLLSFGVSINMHTGRFDFATGATMLLGGVIGAKLSLLLGAGPVGMFAFAVAAGGVFGLLNGILYVTLRLPPMIIGLGLTLLYEGFVAVLTDGCRPVSFGTDTSYYRFAVNIPAMLAVAGVTTLLLVLLFQYTRFGYAWRALQTGQKIAVQTGVNESRNALVCYLVAGLLFGGAGALSICATNGVTPTINFSTIGSMFSCFLPLFFAGFIEKFCPKQAAIFVGCVAYEFLQIGFGQISFAVAAFSADVYRVVEALILVGFLIYLNNEGRLLTLLQLRGRNRGGTDPERPVAAEQ